MPATPSSSSTPLAHRLRPATLDEFEGQEHIVGAGMPLRTAIEHDTLQSVLLAGPPGTGKTTLAQIIAKTTNAQFTQLNAVMSGVKDLREVCSEAERAYTALQQRTVLFIDEIHRFNKAQQDALLPYVESGVVILIGATTENPYFEVNAALVSRSHVYLLQPLHIEHVRRILQRAAEHSSVRDSGVTVQPEALDHIAAIANGDARIALNALELALVTVRDNVTAEEAQRLFEKRGNRYDKNGEDHYNTVSAFIKTMRGSDPDAALLWLFKMLESGEEPRFLFRRMLIFASEDIGNADPRALQIVTAAWQSFEMVGLPEGEYFLAHACIYLAQAPKSDGVKRAIAAAKHIVQHAPSLEVPNHLRNAPVKGMREQGYGEGHVSPHAAAEGVVPANYFPVGVEPCDMYRPTDRGEEADIRRRLEQVKRIVRGGYED